MENIGNCDEISQVNLTKWEHKKMILEKRKGVTQH